MRILVTGGAGFIGSHLSDALLKANHEVVAVDDLSTGSIENVAHLSTNPKFSLVKADIRDDLKFRSALHGCDTVIHLAARIGLKVIVQSPLETIRVNATGSERVIEAAADENIPVIVASTSEVYGLTTKYPSAETDPICFGSPTVGRWSYACTKAYDEFYALATARERKIAAVVVRLFNTVGPRQTGRYGMVIPRFVSQALSGKPLTVYGDGSQTRCFCSVTDVVAALKTMIENAPSLSGEVFNLGNPQEISVLNLAKRVIEITGSKSEISFVPFDEVYPDGFEEIQRRVPEITKARTRLGFDPKVPLDEILRMVADSLSSKELAV